MKITRNIQTDLALEVAETLQPSEMEKGVSVRTQLAYDEQISTTWVSIDTDEGSEMMGKPKGNYITIESVLMKENDTNAHEEIIQILAHYIGELNEQEKMATVLIVGLGNWNVTPDALGPKVVGKVLVTRHIAEDLPKELFSEVRPVAAVSPGVMGITGIETAEIVRGLVDRVSPNLVIAIDALAARKTSRINTTIQLSDTGIAPGAGMGNRRMTLNKENLGVPVIAIGVPTVVDAATLVNDCMDLVLARLGEEMPKGSAFFDMLEQLGTDEKYTLMKDTLAPYVGNLFVTPKEVDEVVNRLANIIANGLNLALHKGIDWHDINRYTV